MTEYTDVPKVNALHLESQQVAQAIYNLENGGTVNTMSVAPPPWVPPEPGSPPAPMAMMVYVTLPPPMDPAMLDATIAWLNQRLVDIAAELTALGVTVPPQGSAAWSTPPAPSMGANYMPPPPQPRTPPPIANPPPPPPPFVPLDSPRGE